MAPGLSWPSAASSWRPAALERFMERAAGPVPVIHSETWQDRRGGPDLRLAEAGFGPAGGQAPA